MLAARRIRRAERRAYGALIRAGFTEPLIAFAVLRQVQVMTQTATLARLDYSTADAAQRGHRRPHLLRARHGTGTRSRAPGRAGRDRRRDRRGGPHAYSQPQRTRARRRHAGRCCHGCRGSTGNEPGRRTILTPATVTPSSSQPPGASSPAPGTPGTRLSQIALAEKLRSEGHKVANNRLRWLAAVSGLEAGQDGEPGTAS